MEDFWKTSQPLCTSGAAERLSQQQLRDFDALASKANQCLIWSPPKVQLFLAYCNINYLEADATLYGSEVTSVMSLNYVLPHACCSSHKETEPKVVIYE